MISMSTMNNLFKDPTARNKQGPKKANFFELMNFVGGKTLTQIFEVKSKKKEYSTPSPFPKKKTSFRLSQNGSLHESFFFSKEDITHIFDVFLEEMTKFQDPIIIPESQTFRLISTYYKIKPSVGSSVIASNIPGGKGGVKSPNGKGQ